MNIDMENRDPNRLNDDKQVRASSALQASFHSVRTRGTKLSLQSLSRPVGWEGGGGIPRVLVPDPQATQMSTLYP